MWKDLPKGLVSAVAAINQKSREAFVAEQQAQRKPKLPGVPAPKADPAANAGAASMAKTGIKEGAEGTVAKTPKEKELAAHHGDKTKITQGDVLKARGVGPFNWRDTARQTSDGKTKTGHTMKKTSTGTQYTKEEVAEVEEGKLMDMGKKVVKAGFRALTGGSDKDQLKNLQGKMGMKQTGEKPKSVKEEVNTDTPGNSYEHQCAIHVKHSKLGEGRTLFSQHAVPDAEGNIAWYDVMFAEGISRVKTDELEILVSESHMNHKKKAK